MRGVAWTARGVKVGVSGVVCESALVRWGAYPVRRRVQRVGTLTRHGHCSWRVVRPRRREVELSRNGVRLLCPAVRCGAGPVERRREGVRPGYGREESSWARVIPDCEGVKRD